MLPALVSAGVRPPGVILSSSAARALSTAQIVAQVFGVSVDVDPALYRASPDEVLAVVASRGQGHQSVMVVAHNSTMHQLVSSLVDDRAPAQFPTSCVAAVELDVGDWPGALVRLGRLVGLGRGIAGPSITRPGQTNGHG